MDRLFLLLGALLLACGGSSQPADTTPQQGAGAGVDPEEQAALARLRASQESVCEKMCPEITECAVEDARANLTAEQLAELDLENTAPQHTRECVEECRYSDLSPRQVRALQVCLEEGGVCSTFLGCLDNAQRDAS